jgi:acyl dehydratase
MRQTLSVLHAEDLTVGRSFATGSWDVTADDIVRFARDWDPVPIHVDEEAAARSPFGGLIASGLHTMAIAVRLGYDNFAADVAIYAGRAIHELRMLKPVRPGMTLTGSIQILEQRLRDDGRGVISWRNRLVDGDGDHVMEFVAEVLVNCRKR